MDINQYQELAMRTLNPKVANDSKLMLLNAVLGLEGESGEIADLVKKHLFQDHPLDRDKIIKEEGDILWYLALIASALEMPMSEFAFIQETQVNTEELTLPDIVLSLCRQSSDLAWEIQQLKGEMESNTNLVLACAWCLWFDVLSLCAFLGVKVNDVLEQNIAKLMARYPEGFSSESSINRR